MPSSERFQSTRPRGARLDAVSVLVGHVRVSIHAPARGATRASSAQARPRSSFNPRAREGRDPALTAAAWACSWVSIHAPARGATRRVLVNLGYVAVSIHAPARGATRLDPVRGRGMKFQSTRPRGARRQDSLYAQASSAFQSTRPRGARLGLALGLGRDLGVSIHAPARGATMLRGILRLCVLFQSTRPRGARQTQLNNARTAQEFQSTRPRGARLQERRGRRAGRAVSIHAPARGATGRGWCWMRRSPCFNPRAREGRDGSSACTATRRPRFNPRAREGRDCHNYPI